jgi:S1-C subfamily serine protease
MKRELLALTSRALVTAGLVLAASASHAQAVPSPEALYRQLAPSVWMVRAYDAQGRPTGSGSAVIIGAGMLLTNCHVVARSQSISVSNDGVTRDALLQYVDPQRDMCQLIARDLDAPAVALADSDQLAIGQKVYTLGHPLGLADQTFSDGMVSALPRGPQSREVLRIQTTAPISPGSSGGGLFDAQGRLVGLTTWQMRMGQNINFAIPVNWARDLAERSEALLHTAAAETRPANTRALSTE